MIRRLSGWVRGLGSVAALGAGFGLLALALSASASAQEGKPATPAAKPPAVAAKPAAPAAKPRAKPAAQAAKPAAAPAQPAARTGKPRTQPAAVGRVILSRDAFLIRQSEAPARLWRGATLRAGMRVRLPKDNGLVFLHEPEGMTYRMRGPAEIIIGEKGVTITPAASVIAKSPTTAEERANAVAPRPVARKAPSRAAEAAPRSAAPRSVTPAAPEAAARRDDDTPAIGPARAAQLYDQARALERDGRHREAMPLYEQAVQGGNGRAAIRLGNIHGTGAGGVPRDYEQQLRWYEKADVLGVPAPRVQRRGSAVP